MSSDPHIALSAHNVGKNFHRTTGELVQALQGVSLEAHHGKLTALVGPDGAGKTTLIRLATCLMSCDEGEMTVLGFKTADHAQEIQNRIGYMPQKFGLYEDLTVQENLDLYADLHGVGVGQRQAQYAKLMEMTALSRFTDRLAGNLSGGMKQKLGLSCALVRAPELLILDEPTVGVDPLSRRELWEIIVRLVDEQGLTVLLSTSYLDEAERCEHVIVLHSGKILAQGAPAEIAAIAAGRTFIAEPPEGSLARSLQARLLDDPNVVDAVPEGGSVRVVCAAKDLSIGKSSSLPGIKVISVEPRFEDGFMTLLRRTNGETPTTDSAFIADARHEAGSETVVEVNDLVRNFGTFAAVDHVSFGVRSGEIFGLLGPNGAGKTTTFRMLCGLLPATGGTLRIAGMDLSDMRAAARQRIGYVAQKFSLYAQLSVAENLEFFASAYGLRGASKRARIEAAIERFDLARFVHLPSGQLPGGYKQRLAIAAALLHEPEILFLDEPTSGADPLARREFWRRITALAEDGVTVIVTTHFMEEAEYCDRVVILDSGRILAEGTPAQIRTHARADNHRKPTMEDAFIAIVEQAREHGHQVHSGEAA